MANLAASPIGHNTRPLGGNSSPLAFCSVEVGPFCSASSVLVVAGKGGAGKSTVAATLAWLGADAGLRCLLVDLEGRPELPQAFGVTEVLGFEPTRLLEEGAGSVEGRLITSELALVEYFDDHGMGRLGRTLKRSGLLEVVANAVPGLRDLLVLGKVKQLEASRAYDLIVVDAPATGHAVTMLTTPAGMRSAATTGPLRQQAEEVAAMLADPSRCRVLLVTLAEELPVAETIEAAFRVEDEAGVALAPVVVNALLADRPGLEVPAVEAARQAGQVIDPSALADLEAARTLQLVRVARQREELLHLHAELPLPTIALPRVASAEVGPAELAQLGAAMRREVEALRGTA